MPLSLAALLVASALAAHADGQEKPWVDSAMNGVYERFARAYRLGLPDSVVVLYTDQPLYLPGQGPVLEGREALRSQFAFLDQLRRNGATAHITFESVARGSSGQIAYDVGYYTIVVEQADGTRRPPNRGKFTTVWRRDAEGLWRIHVDGFSPAPPPDPPAARVPDSASAHRSYRRDAMPVSANERTTVQPPSDPGSSNTPPNAVSSEGA
jgi:ketosteroid isomerase-like protein